VSDDADPNGTWFGYSINSLVNIGGTNYWADYPGFAVGQDAVYITNNVFKFDGDGAFGGSRLWVIPKTPFYSGGTPSNTIYDPSTLAGLGFQLGTLQPAHTFGTTPGNTGTFLVSTAVNTSVGGNDFVDVIRIDNPLGGPSFNYQAINVGDINTAFSLPGAPQSGTSTTVSTNDQRALNAVWRNNNLYLTNTVAPPSGPDAGQATAHWYQINTTNLNALTLADQGNIGGEDIAPNTSTFFPSIAVNSVGDVGIGFSASAATIFQGLTTQAEKPLIWQAQYSHRDYCELDRIAMSELLVARAIVGETIVVLLWIPVMILFGSSMNMLSPEAILLPPAMMVVGVRLLATLV